MTFASQYILKGKHKDIRFIVATDKSKKFNRDIKYPLYDVWEACRAEKLVYTGDTFYLN